MIAEVRRVKLPTPLPDTPPGEAANMADEAAGAPGSQQLLMLVDRSAGEGLIIHLWNDQAAYEAFDDRRQKMVTESEGHGLNVESARMYEVSYSS